MNFMDQLRLFMFDWDKDKIIVAVICVLVLLLLIFIKLYANLKKASEKYTIPLSEFYTMW